jgi:hypothetical protein
MLRDTGGRCHIRRRPGTDLNKELGAAAPSAAPSRYALAAQTWPSPSPDRRGSPDSSGRNTPMGLPPRPRPGSAPPVSQCPTPLCPTPERRKSVVQCTSAMADFVGLTPFPKRHPHIVCGQSRRRCGQSRRRCGQSRRRCGQSRRRCGQSRRRRGQSRRRRGQSRRRCTSRSTRRRASRHRTS